MRHLRRRRVRYTVGEERELAVPAAAADAPTGPTAAPLHCTACHGADTPQCPPATAAPVGGSARPPPVPRAAPASRRDPAHRRRRAGRSARQLPPTTARRSGDHPARVPAQIPPRPLYVRSPRTTCQG